MTIISHCWNEEYLLPSWLEHHRKIFSHGIIYDYNSTDSSRDLIKQYCPTWEIRTPTRPDFLSISCDADVMEAEKTVSDWKIALTITEFLIGDVHGAVANTGSQGLATNGIRVVDKGDATLDPKTFCFGRYDRWRNRLLHCNPCGNYLAGRHEYQTFSIRAPKLFTLWLGYCPWTPEFVERKLQIQYNMAKEDVNEGRGLHHITTASKLNQERIVELNQCSDLLLDPNFKEAYEFTFRS